MKSIQQIAVRAIEEICKTIQDVGLEDVGKVARALLPASTRMTLECS